MIEERINKIRAIKEKYNITNKQISMMSGVPYGTVIKILGGITKSPSFTKIVAIEESLNRFIREETGAMDIEAIDLKVFSKTIEDYYALSGDTRVELIDGVFFDMSSPSIWHQKVTLNMAMTFSSYIKSKKGSCKALISPVDVQLDMDDKTMLQPDFIVVCDENKIREKYISGAPDFVLEVTSKSTRSRDFMLKLSKYKNAGVREYWIIDETSQNVYVYYDMDKDSFKVKTYSFNDTVPVGIYEDLEINMIDIIE